MKIEVGKFYRTRSGRVAEINEIYPLDENGGDPYSYPIRGKIGTEEESWTRTGSEYGYGDCPNDLIAEIDGGGEGIVEAGGCAPPVAVNGPVADVYDAMGERPKPPVEHVEPEYSKDAFNIGNPDAGPQPSTLTIPLGNMTEIDLMGALETVMQSFMHQHDGLPTIAKVRATDWFHAKYGSRP